MRTHVSTYTGRWLLLILCLAVVLRLIGIDFGLPMQLHPDEWSQVEIPRQMLAGDLNPHFFRYSSLLIYQSYVIDSAVALFGQFGNLALPTSMYFLLGRLLSALYGTLSVWALFLLGRSILDERAGLVAALLLAISPEHIRQSHYAIVDVAMTFWIILALVFFLQTIQKRSLSLLAAGVATGLAISTKYSAALVLLPIVPFIIWHLWRSGETGPVWLKRPRIASLFAGFGMMILVGLYLLPVEAVLKLGQSWTTQNMIKPEYLSLFNNLLGAAAGTAIAAVGLGVGALWVDPLRRLASILLHPQFILFLASVGGVFALTSPFVFLDLPHSVQDIFYEYRHMLLGAAAQFSSNDPILATFQPNVVFPAPAYYWNWWLGQNGWLIVAITLFGAAVLARNSPFGFGVTAIFVVVLVFALTRAGNKADRYALPLLPMFAIWASAGMSFLFKIRIMERRRALQVVLLAAVCLVPLLSAWRIIYQQFILPDTRVLAFNWLRQNVPPGAVIVREFGTPDLEHTDGLFRTIATTGAFESKSFLDWQNAGVKYILVGSLREWYRTQANLYPQINESYSELERRARLIQTIAASSTSYGSSIWIYQLP